jgi:hypothetical protein
MSESQFSINTFVYGPAGEQYQVTMRGEQASGWKEVLKNFGECREFLVSHGYALTRPAAQGQAGQSAPNYEKPAHAAAHAAQAPNGNGGGGGEGEVSFEDLECNKVSVEFSPKGEKVARVFGGRFMKFGVKLWPEAAVKVGLNLDALNAGEYQFDKTVRIMLRDGRPQKVLDLAGPPPKAQAAPQARHLASPDDESGIPF